MATERARPFCAYPDLRIWSCARECGYEPLMHSNTVKCSQKWDATATTMKPTKKAKAGDAQRKGSPGWFCWSGRLGSEASGRDYGRGVKQQEKRKIEKKGNIESYTGAQWEATTNHLGAFLFATFENVEPGTVRTCCLQGCSCDAWTLLLLLGASDKPLARSIMPGFDNIHLFRSTLTSASRNAARSDQSATTTLLQSKSASQIVFKFQGDETFTADMWHLAHTVGPTPRSSVLGREGHPKNNLKVSLRSKSRASQRTHSLFCPSRTDAHHTLSPVTTSTLCSEALTRAASVQPLDEVRWAVSTAKTQVHANVILSRPERTLNLPILQADTASRCRQ